MSGQPEKAARFACTYFVRLHITRQREELRRKAHDLHSSRKSAVGIHKLGVSEMAIQWSPALSTGLEWQDDEHKELILRINKLLDAMRRNAAKQTLEELFGFLSNYVIEHFGHEETMMLKKRFPGYQTHKQAHSAFIVQFKDLKKTFDKEGASAGLTMQVQGWLGDWLLRHIGQVDKAMAVHTLTADR
jgi:hemerythrin